MAAPLECLALEPQQLDEGAPNDHDHDNDEFAWVWGVVADVSASLENKAHDDDDGHEDEERQGCGRLSDIPANSPLPSRINKERDNGNVEYKLQLTNPPPRRFQKLVTQLNFRLLEGNGTAVYLVGVCDNGKLMGISEDALEHSIATLHRMAASLQADARVVRQACVCSSDVEANERWVAEVVVQRLSSNAGDAVGSVVASPTRGFVEVRVALCGAVTAGKTTLVAVLTQGDLDNGHGSARTHILRHKHEVQTGHTSSVGLGLLGFDALHHCINHKCDPPPTWSEICANAAKVVLFHDLPGHERFVSCALGGVMRQFPDCAVLVVSADDPMPPAARLHLAVVLALDLPLAVVITKADQCSPDRLLQTFEAVSGEVRAKSSRELVFVRHEDHLPNPQSYQRVCPVFAVSSVNGSGVELVKLFFSRLTPQSVWQSQGSTPRFHIDDVYSLPDVGTVVSGTLVQGSMRVGQELTLGPWQDGSFRRCGVSSIHTTSLPAKAVSGPKRCCIAVDVELGREAIRKGMVLLHPSETPSVCWEFDARVSVVNESRLAAPRDPCVAYFGGAKQVVHIRSRQGNRCSFAFQHRPEFLHTATKFVYRQGLTVGVGVVCATRKLDLSV